MVEIILKGHLKPTLFSIFMILALIPNVLTVFNKDLSFSNRKFRVMQVTDIHYGEEDPTKDTKTTKLMENLILKTKPDLISLTGDAISGYSWDDKNQTFTQDNWNSFTTAFNSTMTPYAYTTGNHDTEGNLNIYDLVKMDLNHPYSAKRLNFHPSYPENLMNFKWPVTTSNFYTLIYSSINPGQVASVMWYFDSGNSGCEEMGIQETWGCITSSQIEWYETNSMLIKNELGYMPSGFAFFHIPIQEFRLGYNFRESYSGHGIRGEEICCPKKQTFVFDSILKTKNIKAVFCGHDHNNDFCVELYGVELCYGRKTGYGGYGPNGFERGVRIIDLIERLDDNGNPTFDYTQFILEENGNIVPNDSNKGFKGKTDFVGRCEKP